jgi:flagellar biosynthesis protein FliP
VQLLVLMTVLSLAPSILVMVTAFTRIVVVFRSCAARSACSRPAQRGGDHSSRSSSPP